VCALAVSLTDDVLVGPWRTCGRCRRRNPPAPKISIAKVRQPRVHIPLSEPVRRACIVAYRACVRACACAYPVYYAACPYRRMGVAGTDTSIKAVHGDRVWANYAPEGCVHTQASAETTPAQRDRFKAIVQARTYSVPVCARAHACVPASTHTHTCALVVTGCVSATECFLTRHVLTDVWRAYRSPSRVRRQRRQRRTETR
jgi:hypothetical protein